ncbi:Zinc phosphodiesterase ELAC protein 1 [Cyanidiococcus yangmingshanensis]|uniref:Zinc phosphodiesterase ELAC protein 1 n=1 Tax=Cyanidiococcus yangmingshanensis TaxID=2690220 RepID=A0A7J7IHA7_9RHOD|nr:Zinc phosphodiesterase ELAC protein 1 [Cyanidiococcus yangmingshanensis]
MLFRQCIGRAFASKGLGTMMTAVVSTRGRAKWFLAPIAATRFVSYASATNETANSPDPSASLPAKLRGSFQGLELTFLGTGAAAPSTKRNVSSIALRIGLAEHRKAASLWLFDVGEATQHQLCRSHLHMGRIERIFLTHLHGDHCFGLAGLLCGLGMNNNDNDASALVADSDAGEEDARRGPPLIHVYGPPGLRLLVRSSLGVGKAHPRLRLCMHEIVPPSCGMLKEWYEWSKKCNGDESRSSRQQWRTWTESLNSPITCRLPPLPFEEPGSDYFFRSRADVETDLPDPVTIGSIALKIVDDERGSVYVAPLQHSVPCFGYTVVEKVGAHRLNTEILREKYKLEAHPVFKDLKLGRRVLHPYDSNKWIEPAEVLLPPKAPRKVVILGDTCDSTLILPAARECQLLVHEATLGDELSHRARSVQHSTARMAGAFAKRVGVTGALALTHISARYDDQESKTSKHLLAEAQQAASGGRFTIFIAEDLQRVQVPWTQPQSNQSVASSGAESSVHECEAQMQAVS